MAMGIGGSMGGPGGQAAASGPPARDAGPGLKGGLDTLLLSLFVLILGIGLVNLLSASSALAQLRYKDPYHFLRAQSLRVLAGLFLGILAYVVPLRRLRALAPWALPASILLLGASFLPFLRDEGMGTYRWIRVFSVSIQPSEFARAGVVLFLAWAYSRCGDLGQGLRYGFLPQAAILVLVGGLIVLERDLGGAVIIAGLIVALCFLAGLRARYLLVFVLILGAGFYYYVSGYGYRVDRISGWLDPFADPQGKGYVIIHAFFAFANGGILGVGPGESLEKLFFIPEVHTDYVFAVVGEELGLVGVTLVSGLFLALAIRGMMIARASTSVFDYYLACGSTLMVALPAFVNIGVALSLFPAKGLALPFFSYGGSNMVVSCLAVGLLMGVARRAARRGPRGGAPGRDGGGPSLAGGAA
jgi:cell division protein FtsW